jgi:filamentous hemagglutinin
LATREAAEKAAAEEAEQVSKAALAEVARKNVWSLPPIQRGRDIEAILAKTEYADWFHIGAEGHGTFPLVDFQKGNTLVSLKTVNTAGKTWMSRMQQVIEDLGTRGATVDGKPAQMVLDLRVQPGGAAAAQPLVDFGKQYGVQVTVREFP